MSILSGLFQRKRQATTGDDVAALAQAAEKGELRAVRRLLAKGVGANSWVMRNYEARGALELAAENGHTGVVRLLLTAGANPDREVFEGKTALAVASEHAHWEVVQVILDTNPKNGLDYALLKASRHGNLAMVRKLLTRGTNVNYTYDGKATAISNASENGHLSVVRELLDRCADPNPPKAPKESNSAALLLAIENQHTEVARTLIEGRADVNIQNDHGETPLIAASERGQLGTVQMLIQANADIEAKTKDSRHHWDWDKRRPSYTALYAASKNGHLDVVRALLNAGAAVSTQSSSGETAIEAAAKMGHNHIVHALIDHGAQIAESDASLPNASRCGDLEMVRCLLRAGANVNGWHDGETALMIAAEAGHIDIVRALLELGADPKPRGYRHRGGRNALHLAAANGHDDVVKALLDAGAAVDARTEEDEETALMLASTLGHFEAAKALMVAGAQVINCGGAFHDAATRQRNDIVQLLNEAIRHHLDEAGVGAVRTEALQPEWVRHLATVIQLLPVKSDEVGTSTFEKALERAIDHVEEHYKKLRTSPGSFTIYHRAGDQTSFHYYCRVGDRLRLIYKFGYGDDSLTITKHGPNNYSVEHEWNSGRDD